MQQRSVQLNTSKTSENSLTWTTGSNRLKLLVARYLQLHVCICIIKVATFATFATFSKGFTWKKDMLEDLLFENLPFTNLQKNGIHGALCFIRVYGDFCLVIYYCNIAENYTYFENFCDSSPLQIRKSSVRTFPMWSVCLIHV